MADVTASLAIHPAYRTRLRQVLMSLAHTAHLAPQPGLELVEASCEGVVLAVLVDPQTHRVRQAAYRGPTSDIQRGLLEVLCDTVIDRPIQECAEHAVIYVEDKLRDPSWARPVPGILGPDNADPAFQLPTVLVRSLAAAYCKATGYVFGANFYDPPASPGWRALSRERKRASVAAALADVLTVFQLSSAEVVLLDVGNDNRVWLEFKGETPGAVKGYFLMRVEAALKARVEQSLHVYTADRKDLNKIRRLAAGAPAKPGSSDEGG